MNKQERVVLNGEPFKGRCDTCKYGTYTKAYGGCYECHRKNHGGGVWYIDNTGCENWRAKK